MSKRLFYEAMLTLLLLSTIQPLGAGEDSRTNSHTKLGLPQHEGDIVCVVLRSIGYQRVPIDPVVLFAGDAGWELRRKKFSPKELEHVDGQRISSDELSTLFSSVKSHQDWIRDSDYGTTELTFYKSDAHVQILFLERKGVSAAIELLRADLPPDSPVWKYVRLINRSFPIATDVPVLEKQ
jgi:hypothetical protein